MYSCVNEIIDSNKFYKISGDWDYDGGGLFGNMWGSGFGVALDTQDDSDEVINSTYKNFKNLANSGYIEVYYDNGNAEAFIAGSIKNANLTFDIFFPLPLPLDSDLDEDYKNEFKAHLTEISEKEYKKNVEKCLKILEKEKNEMLKVDADDGMRSEVLDSLPARI